ncbi:MAG: hypothetical protein ACR2FV_07565 [Ornithinimicrobium sp.]|jgi:hypothetical protein|uniref:hypothetical protein n=1 Tax=Ornithinimicrobium sp. TaxID=1977084 RepID=UPI00184566A9|nr:prevent-host-death protein [Actinomycetota bacterium]
MNHPRHFSSFTDARKQLRSVLDAAQQGLVTTLERDRQRYVVLLGDHLREDLAALRPADAVVVAEGGGWSVILPGLPVHGDAETFDGAIEDAVDALREYAQDWNDRLHLAPNHRQHRVVVELVELSNDEQLREWLVVSPHQHASDPDRLATA